MTSPIRSPTSPGTSRKGRSCSHASCTGKAIFPPVDVLPSLSRLMNAGIGKGRTVPEHRQWADQLYALYAQGREARLMAAIVGEAGLGAQDRRALALAERFEREFIGQPEGGRRIEETFAAGWRLLGTLPRGDLTRLSDETWRAHLASTEATP